MDTYFHLDAELYERHYRPIYERKFRPAAVIEFIIPLPFQVPFRDGFCVTTYYEEAMFTTRFNSWKVRPYCEPMWSDAPQDVRRTFIQALVAITEFPEGVEVLESIMTGLFDGALRQINDCAITYGVMTADREIYRISRQQLAPMVMYQVYDVRSAFKRCFMSSFWCSTDLAVTKDVLPEDVETKFFGQFGMMLYQTSPFTQHKEFELAALRWLQIGQYRHAIIEAQTSVEAFSRVSYRLIAPDEEQDLHYKDLIKVHLLKCFGIGTPDPSEAAHPVNRYWELAYKLRNQIVHEGYSPDYYETCQALDAAFSFRTWILRLAFSTDDPRFEPIRHNFEPVVLKPETNSKGPE